jgi:zinc-binding alcohol dehydrogenase family protein
MTASTTRAIAVTKGGPVDAPESFVEIELELEEIGAFDLLVEVKAVSVNPVDAKTRRAFSGEKPKVLGFDAAGTVIEIGSSVDHFAVGDDVYYAGTLARAGSNADRQVVDSRIVGHKPEDLDFAEAAAMPLTSITAWESLFDHLALTKSSTGHLLVVGGAGGVGSMITQLARALTDVTVIATASRPESAEWARSMGAHHVVDRHELIAGVNAIAPNGVKWIFSSFSAGNAQNYADLLTVRGAVVAIDGPEGLDTLPLKPKAQSWHWEYMFARPLHEPESTYQRELLDRLHQLVDDGTVRTTVTQRLSGLTTDTLREAHRLIESSASIGKVVVENS